MILLRVEKPRPGSVVNRVGFGSKEAKLETLPLRAYCALWAQSVPFVGPQFPHL